ncbi:MAG: peptidoglycan DD-metalloendopeptidase family protein [bacterium]
MRFKRASHKKVWPTLLINKKVIHALMIVLTIFLAYTNLTNAKEATSSEDVVRKTMLARLVSDEFVEYDDLIEEYQVEGTSFTPTKETYLAENVIKPQARINTHEELDYLDEFDFDTIQVGEIEDYIATKESVPERSGKIAYVVKPGDTASTIAQKFGISVNTVLWANNLTAHSYIRPGDSLIILPMTGVLHTVSRGENMGYIAKYYDIDAGKIMTANNISNANQLSIGQEIIIPDGSKQGSRTIASPTAPSGSAVATPKESAKPVYGTKMNWPTEGHRITQYYSWRHNGLDIANKAGTAIYAADAGTVEIAGWNAYGYGNQIVINHGGGKKTRYAHLSSFAVSVGASVSKGQYIAGMGSTGRSTGSHLHFEVMFNGTRYNPLNYIEY